MNTLTITHLKVNGQAHTACTDTNELHFSVWVEGAAETMRLRLMEGDTLCWDSGTLPWQPYYDATLPLKSKTRYTVVAEVGGAGAAAEAVMTLRSGMMGETWQGQWIEPQQEAAIPERDILFFEQFVPMPDHFGGHDRLRPVQELRRCFTLDKLPEAATLYASAHGVYALWLNGKRVDSRRLAPETTPYESLLYYQIYDLTPFLQEGENTLRVLLADGWWIGRIGLTGHSCQYGDRLGFLGQLELSYGDGTADTIVTDSCFASRPSHICYADLFMGEKWDMTANPAPWTPCTVAEAADNTLTVQPIAPISAWTTLDPVAVMSTPNGELVADFGQCLAGVVELRLSCPAGTVVTLDHSETLDTEGNFFRNILGRNKDQQDMVICGEGETAFCPEFTYHGFRYVRISGASREQVLSIRALVIGTPLEELGSFSCSDALLTQLQGNIRRSTRSNMVSVPTDCPQREKMGWTGDIQVFVPTGSFNYDLSGFLGAWLGQMRLSQTEDGGIPIIIPSYPAQTAMQLKTNGGNTSSAWSDACVLVPWQLYKMYGDKQVLRDNLPMMEKWMAYIAAASHDYLWTEGYHFGDWLIPSYQDDIEGGTKATAPVIAACQYAVTTAALIEVLEVLGEKDKVEQHRNLLYTIRKAICRKFVREDGTVEGGTQGLYVMVLHSGAVEGELAKKVAAHLAEKIAENGGALDTGFVSTPHLLNVLMDNGYEDLAWQLLMRTESPSWLYQVVCGATTIWENWNAIRPDGTVTASSYNHYALGSVGSWMYRHIGGLHPMEAGWRTMEFAPAFRCVDSAQCSHLTPYGLAACSWKKTAKGVEIEVQVPHGITAWLRIGEEKRPLTAGTHTFTI